MKILFSNNYAERRLQEMQLEEFTLGHRIIEGYQIMNRTGDFPFGGSCPEMHEKLLNTQSVCLDYSYRLTEEQRDAFWEAVSQAFINGVTLFDVDKWYEHYKGANHIYDE